VEEVTFRMRKMSERIDKARKVQCFSERGLWQDMVFCDAAFYPHVLGNLTKDYLLPADVKHMRLPSTRWHWIKIGEVQFFGNFYLDFYIFEQFFRRSFGHHSTTEVMMNGTFLETGGSDGVRASNTLFFERYLNWGGVIIEPTVCAVAQIPYNRPTSQVFRGAVCEKEGNISVSDMKDFCPDYEWQNFVADPEWEKPVRCSPIKTYIDEAVQKSLNNIDRRVKRTIDFMSIDVEGYFMSALKSVPFKEYNIRVMVVECKTQECYDYLEARGYNLVKAGTIKNVPDDVIAWKNDC